MARSIISDFKNVFGSGVETRTRLPRLTQARLQLPRDRRSTPWHALAHL